MTDLDNKDEETRVLGIDYGERRIGVAVSDPLGLSAQGLPTLTVRSQNEAVQAVVRTAKEYSVSQIVVGLPLRLDGTPSEGTEKAVSFSEALRRSLDIPVSMWDERMSSKEARRVLIEAGEKTGEKKGRVDRIAATILLQSYLDRKRMTEED